MSTVIFLSPFGLCVFVKSLLPDCGLADPFMWMVRECEPLACLCRVPLVGRCIAANESRNREFIRRDVQCTSNEFTMLCWCLVLARLYLLTDSFRVGGTLPWVWLRKHRLLHRLRKHVVEKMLEMIVIKGTVSAFPRDVIYKVNERTNIRFNLLSCLHKKRN